MGAIRGRPLRGARRGAGHGQPGPREPRGARLRQREVVDERVRHWLAARLRHELNLARRPRHDRRHALLGLEDVPPLGRCLRSVHRSQLPGFQTASKVCGLQLKCAMHRMRIVSPCDTMSSASSGLCENRRGF